MDNNKIIMNLEFWKKNIKLFMIKIRILMNSYVNSLIMLKKDLFNRIV